MTGLMFPGLHGGSNLLTLAGLQPDVELELGRY